MKKAEDLIPEVDTKFVRRCLDVIGAPKSWMGQNTRRKLIAWIKMEEHVRPLAFKTKPPMIAITVQNGLSIPASLKVGAFRVRPAQALNCQDGGEGDEEAV